MKGDMKTDLHITDPEFAERFEYFAFNEVINEENQQLDEKTRYMAILAALIGCGGVDAYKEMLPQAFGKRYYSDSRKGNCLSGNRLFGLWQNAAFFEYYQ